MDPLCVDSRCRTDWRKFYDLDKTYSPRLTEKEFLSLFVKCDSCVFITMHQTFGNHHYSPETVDGAN